jgi:hypothetical protein
MGGSADLQAIESEGGGSVSFSARPDPYSHGNEFDKIAISGHKKWQETAANLGAWFV